MSCASRPHLSCWFLEHFFKQTNLRVSEACNWLTAAAGPCGKQWNNKLYAATHMRGLNTLYAAMLYNEERKWPEKKEMKLTIQSIWRDGRMWPEYCLLCHRYHRLPFWLPLKLLLFVWIPVSPLFHLLPSFIQTREIGGYVMESRSSCCRLMCINEPACLQKQRWGKWENRETWKQQTLIPGEFHVSCYLHILMECVQCHSFSGMQSAVHSNKRRFCTVPMEMLIPKEKTNQRAKLNTIQTVTVSDGFLSHSETNTLCPIKRK